VAQVSNIHRQGKSTAEQLKESSNLIFDVFSSFVNYLSYLVLNYTIMLGIVAERIIKTAVWVSGKLVCIYMPSLSYDKLLNAIIIRSLLTLLL
jgi:hypothetical protein